MTRKWGQQARWAQTRAGWQADLVVRSCLGGVDFMDMTRPQGAREAGFRTERCARGRKLLLSFLGCTAQPGAQTPVGHGASSALCGPQPGTRWLCTRRALRWTRRVAAARSSLLAPPRRRRCQRPSLRSSALVFVGKASGRTGSSPSFLQTPARVTRRSGAPSVWRSPHPFVWLLETGRRQGKLCSVCFL